MPLTVKLLSSRSACLSLRPEVSCTPKSLWQRPWGQEAQCDTSVCLVAPKTSCRERPKEMEKLLASSCATFARTSVRLRVERQQGPRVTPMLRCGLAMQAKPAQSVMLLVKLLEAF